MVQNDQRVIRHDFYSNLEVISAEARKSGKPMWAFALSISHYSYPVPTISDLRLQVYSNLAYGAQCIQYFTYFPALGSDLGPVNNQGNPNPVYYVLQQMNEEIKARSKVFLNAKVQWTAHTGEIPAGCVELDKSQLPAAIHSLEISDPGALVSLLEKGNDSFLVIVNHGLGSKITVKVSGTKELRRIKKDGSSVPVDAGLTLAPGDALIYFWKNK
jgi:hypothetical protein